jgi:hypothetical protein
MKERRKNSAGPAKLPLRYPLSNRDMFTLQGWHSIHLNRRQNENLQGLSSLRRLGMVLTNQTLHEQKAVGTGSKDFPSLRGQL